MAGANQFGMNNPPDLRMIRDQLLALRARQQGGFVAPAAPPASPRSFVPPASPGADIEELSRSTNWGGHSASIPLPSSDSSPLLPSNPSVPSTGLGEPVILMGNKSHARTVKSFLKTMQKRGIPLPFDPKTLDPAVLNTTVPKGQTLALSQDGRIVGLTSTEQVMGDENLHLATHMDPRRGKNRLETESAGGDVLIDGVSHDVSKSFLKSPIMLDLTGDGKLGTTGVSTAQKRIDGRVGKTVAFDIDGDGHDDQIEWMDGQGDGMLVDDTDGGATAAMQGNGRIDGTRLFGDQGGRFANGYEKLALKDANHDGKLTGQELSGLKTWVDDGDAVLEQGEMKTLAEQGVTELGATMHTEQNARGEALMRSSMVRHGKAQATEDVWFRQK